MSAVAANAAVLGRREVRVVKSFAVYALFCSMLDTTCLTFNHMAMVPSCCILQRTLLVRFLLYCVDFWLCFHRLPNPSSHALAPSMTPLSVSSPLSMSTAGLSETVFRQRLYSVACARGPVSAILYAAGRNDV